jgi:2-keto-3-deoxy-L-rhamnonate aldolase RhmA
VSDPAAAPERAARRPAADDFVLTLWTADPELAAHADAAGVDRVGVDLERLGKDERQAGLGTWISPHTLDDLAAVGGALRRARPFARVDPLNPGSAEQIERAIAAGAEVVMLPMLTTADEVAEFVRLLDGRAEPVLLLERRAAVEAIDEIVAVPGAGEVHVGLNDLSLDMGAANRFAVVVSDEVERVAEATLRAGLRFGIGGLGRVDDLTLPIPGDLVYAQHARLGSTAALISRRFAPPGGDPAAFAAAVRATRKRLSEWWAAGPDAIAAAHRELQEATAASASW